MEKRLGVSLLISILISFTMVGGSFHAYLLADDVNSVERDILKKHLLATEGLSEAVMAFSEARLANIEKIDNFLANEYVETQLAKWGYSANKVRTAVRTLTNAELEYLVLQSENVSRNFYGGANTSKIFGLAGLGALVLIIAVYQFFDWPLEKSKS
jgi:hypothetical protein